MKRITIVGDIMCERPVLTAGKQEDGSYDFSPIFEKMKPMFDESDYVIGNMEFPVAGEDMTYGDSFLFSTLLTPMPRQSRKPASTWCPLSTTTRWTGVWKALSVR